MRTTGLAREDAASESGQHEYNTSVDNFMRSTGLNWEDAKAEKGRLLREAYSKNKTREEISADKRRAGKMSLGKGMGPKIINGKPPDWMVVVEVDQNTKIERSDPGPRCTQMKQEMAAQLADWGAMSFNTALQLMAIFLKGK
jgi:hypothetical protein